MKLEAQVFALMNRDDAEVKYIDIPKCVMIVGNGISPGVMENE
jgi:hypothetical protein